MATSPSASAATTSPSHDLIISDVAMSLGRRESAVRVLDHVTLAIARRCFVTILGPNGCGKSTLLRLIAGLMKPTRGEILHQGRRVSGPHHSRLMMFQDRTLFPWMTVIRNLQFAVKANRHRLKHGDASLESYLRLVGLNGFENAYPSELSGGMQQRAELARALAVQPELLLLDEPLASVDALTREVMQEELLRIRAELSATVVMVTHDISEAVFVSDLIVLMSNRPGRIKEVIPVPEGDGRSVAWRRDPLFAELCSVVRDLLRPELSDSSLPDRAVVNLREG